MLRDLEGAGLVLARRSPEIGIFELNEDHYLAPALVALFDDERHEDQAVIGFVRELDIAVERGGFDVLAGFD